MAIGEAACVSVHGANRLGTNSLIDLVVFGRAAALRCAETISPGDAQAELPKQAADLALTRLDRFRHARGGTPVAKLRLKMQQVMQQNCEVYRAASVLQEGVRQIAEVWRASDDVGIADRSLMWNTELVETLELDNLVAQAAVTVSSALNRQESRGAHFREDFPDRLDSWMKHTLAWADAQTASVKIDYRPVHTKAVVRRGKVLSAGRANSLKARFSPDAHQRTSSGT
jgi:succinate dehydrogenase / fumarate reductase flavoprotein subunit